MTNIVNYRVNLEVVGEKIVGEITSDIGKMTEATRKATKTFGDCYKALWSISLVSDGLAQLEQSFQNVIQPGVALNTNMAELSAITGVTGEGLKEIERAARATSKTFGTDASANVESYKLVLSQLDPKLAQSSEAMKQMGDNISILSKQLGGDTVMATNVLTTSMNQFGISTEDPIQAAKVMGDMMNTMSAAAQAGSAELPQIKSALEQVGMVAKTTGLSFEETNAQIQILDKAGRKGSEGGVALRNVLTTLSEGRFTSKLAADGLAEAGISVEYLADTSIPLTERLRSLRKVQDDTALMSKIFGKENMAAAIAMINGIESAEALTEQITGTNSAVEQGEIIMGSYAEKMARTKAWVDDLKIGFFNLIEPIAPVTQGFFTAFSTMGQMAVSGNALITTFQQIKLQLLWNTIKLKAYNLRMGIGSVMNKIFGSTLKGVRTAFFQATVGATIFGVALDALGIGLVLLAIAGLIAGLKYLWENSRRFREILYGIGYAGKAVFHNIGVFVKRLWNLIIKPVALWIWNIYKLIFTNIWNFIKMAIDGISSAFNWLWNDVIKPVALWIWEVMTSVFQSIYDTVSAVFSGVWDFASGVWGWIKETFGTFATWIEDTLITPVYDAFTKVWDWLKTLLDNIINKLSSVFQPIINLWNKLFSSEGMSDISVAYHEGEKAGGESFDRDKDKKKEKDEDDEDDEPQKVELVKDNSQFDLTKETPKTPTLGGAAVKSLTQGKAVGSGGGNESGNKVRNLTIGKMMENFNVHMNASNGIDKTQLLNAVREVLLTASADFAGAN